MAYFLFIEGKIKPRVRTTQKQKFVDPRYAEYRTSQSEIKLQISNQMQRNAWDMLPEKTPLYIDIRQLMPKALHRSDADNMIKAILDGMQHIVFKNDAWIDKIHMERRLEKDGRYTTAIEIGVLNEIAA